MIAWIISSNNFCFKLKTKIVGGYYPCNHEIDDLEILNLFSKNKKITSLPIIKKDNQMDFYEWSKDNPLKINKYGIIEPLSQKKVYPDILLVPLLANSGTNKISG